jgi:photosystem II stability/assembly factor-like uncharacterized protein
MNDVTFVGQDGWAVGGYRTILHTSDGGKSWVLQRGGNTKILDEESYFAVAFLDAQHGWVAGLSGDLLYTSDGGQTWHEYGGSSRPSLFAIGIARPALWVGGKRGVLLKHGPDNSWRDIHVRLRDITDIAFSGNTGIAVGLGGTILETADGGNTWHSAGAE